jgi:serine/threonine-protein kinase
VVGSFVTLLCFNTVMLARAIVVPSTARRTLLLGLVGVTPLIAVVFWRAAVNTSPVASAVAAACWSSVGIALGTVASQTIFGLRREVAQARVLGQYTLESKIGEGGMGEVWRASHALLRRPTAIKLLRPERTGDAAIRRFEREVQLTALLTHPSTVSIYDYGRTRDGTFYYAMELLDGTDLERLVDEDGPQPPGRVAHLLAQICGALAEAHDLHLVHRDIKPANVLLLPRRGEQELAKVVDFGLVKDVRIDGADAHLTAANTITGTPLFLSPEAILEPESIDGASDLYALGALGWYLLVGRPPFEGRTVLEICGKHLHTPPARPSEALGRPVPADLEDIVLACLEKRPRQRPAGARALRGMLNACSAAGAWSEEQAASWWAVRARAQRPTLHDGRAQRTIALDVTARAV